MKFVKFWIWRTKLDMEPLNSEDLSSDQGPPCSIKDHHNGGTGGQGEGVQGGPLWVGVGPYDSDQILDLSNKTFESAIIGY